MADSLEWLRNDTFFITALRDSRRSNNDRRARANAKLLLNALENVAHEGEIYDYWRSLEQFWRRIDHGPRQDSM